jgi:hypothetical protein
MVSARFTEVELRVEGDGLAGQHLHEDLHARRFIKETSPGVVPSPSWAAS